MKTSKKLLIILFVFILQQANAANFYWVGGSGVWSDFSNHWSLSSGGIPNASAIPSTTDTAIFDGNSFTATGEIVSGLNNIAIARITINTGAWNPVITGSKIIIGSAIELQSGVQWDSLLTIEADAAPGEQVSINTGLVSIGDITTSLTNNGIRLDNYLYCNGSIIISNGEFQTNNNPIRCKSMNIIGSVNGHIYLGSSGIYTRNFEIHKSVLIPYQFFGDSANIAIADTGSIADFTIFSDEILKVKSVWTLTDALISGSDFITSKLILLKPTTITVNKIITDSLVVYNGCSTLSILGLIQANVGIDIYASSANPVQINSPVVGNIYMVNGFLCTDYLIIQNVNAIGGANFYAGANSINSGGNYGWIYDTCGAAVPGYYWVGNSGDWSDLNHWSTTSGGTVLHTTLPTSSDNIYVDQNSFNVSGTITGSAVVFCRNLYIQPIANVSIDFSSFDSILVSGDVSLNSNVAWDNGTSLCVFPDFQSSIQSGGTVLFRLSTYGNAELVDDIIVQNSLNIRRGFKSNGKKITADALFAYESVNLSGSHVESHNIILDNAGQLFGPNILDETTFYMSTNAADTIGFKNPAGEFIKEIHVDGESRLELYGHVERLIISDNVQLMHSVIVDNLILNNPVDTLILTTGDTLTIINEIVSYGDPINHTTIAASNNSAYVSKSTGDICLHFTDLSNIVALGLAQFYADTTCTDLGGNTGWQFIPCSIISDVWPGDANYDGIVSNDDILNIGLAFNSSGPVRPAASIAYVAQPASDWNNYFVLGSNYKHADTNGDGVVDDSDTTAVSLNYGQTHPLRLSTSSGSGTELYIVVNDSASMGDTIQIDFYLGTAVNPAIDVYGIAFTLEFNDSIADSTYSSFDYSNSWLGTPGIDLLTFEKPFINQGKIDFALTRTDQNNVSGSGLIGSCGIVIVDNIGAKLTVPFTITDAIAISANEDNIPLSIINDSLELDTVAVGVDEISLAEIALYPNPSYGSIKVHSNEIVESIQITDLTGNIVTSVKVNSRNPQLKLDLNPGLYIIKVQTEKGSISKKLSIASRQ